MGPADSARTYRGGKHGWARGCRVCTQLRACMLGDSLVAKAKSGHEAGEPLGEGRAAQAMCAGIEGRELACLAGLASAADRAGSRRRTQRLHSPPLHPP